LQVKELRISGFKSFVDPIRAPIEPGLTGVVGPNGCGKSNLLESVRWVMGAASAKAMRAEDMDDVIFAGAAARPAREHAEVTLVLDNADKTAPEAFNGAEILEVTRKIRRGAGSSYKINGRDARAKDVQLLFADASTGANSPALVRQGQISELIAAKPENRRRILEEAAGISGLHSRRHEADLKLKAAEANLARLEETLKDIDGQAASLRRQARAAERYRAVSEEIRQTEALLAWRRWRAALEAKAEAEALARGCDREAAQAAEAASVAQRLALEAGAKLPALREEAMIAGAVLRGVEGRRVSLERDVAEADAALARAEADLKRLGEDLARAGGDDAAAAAALARLEAEAQALSAGAGAEALGPAKRKAEAAEAARIAAAAKFEALRETAATAQAERARARVAHEAASQRLARAKSRRDEIERRFGAFANDADLAGRRAAAAQTLKNADANAARARAALAAAEAARAEADDAERTARAAFDAAAKPARDLAAEVKALDALTRPGKGAARPAIGEVQVAPDYAKALAAALGDDLDAALDAKEPVAWAGAAPPKAAWPEGCAPLAPHVEAPEALAARLALCALVDRMDGPALQKNLAPGQRIVSREGDLWRWDGFVRRAEAPTSAAARLEQAARLKAAKAALTKALAKENDAKDALAAAQTAREAAAAGLQSARKTAPAAEEALAAARRDEARLTAEIAAAEARRGAFDAERKSAEAELSEAQAALAAAPAPIDAPGGDAKALDLARAEAEKTRAAAAEAQAAMAGLERAEAARLARLTAIEREGKEWRDRRAAGAARTGSLGAELEAAEAMRAKAKAAPEAARAALAKLTQEAAGVERRDALARDAMAAVETRLREADRAVRDGEAALAEASRRREAAHQALASASHAAAEATRAAQETAEGGPDLLIEKAGRVGEGPFRNAPLFDIEKRLARLAGERDAAGPVNLRAEEELSEAQARLAALAAEKDDVAQAINKLRHAIGRLNGEGRARLLKAFDLVNGHFGRLFATLFEGGQAELKLTESDDPLAAGLEIYASPPGKKLARLSLMSGGEQALTAAALIFAVFLANPAPLCVLDEVDAPLDDANVDRFCSMLEAMRQSAQTRFIVITHNPVTMARMDRLYGVTMAEQGVSQLVSVDLQKATALAAA
jgi:chromosome segregation protein